MDMYLLNSAACLAILMVFYKLLLEKENMHVFKRFYLLGAVLASFIIPWITFTTYSEPLPAEAAFVLQPEVTTGADIERKYFFNLSYLLWTFYGVGVLFFGTKFILNLRILLQRIKRNPKIRSGSTTNVLLQEKLAPHTFWNYIFLNKDKFEKREIPMEVFQHEQAHADQRHSADILFMEFLQVIFWFHPLLYPLKTAIRLNHEFLADRAVLKEGVQPAIYQKTLLAFSSNASDSNLVNPINYQSIKKRFTVMRTNTSRKIMWGKSLVLLPLLAVLVYSFSTRETVINNSSAEFQQKKNYTLLPSGDTLVIPEDINIRLVSTEHLVLNGNQLSYDELPAMLEVINPHLSGEERNKMVSAEILTTEEFPVGWVNDVKRALYYYGIARSKVTLTDTPQEKEGVIQSKKQEQEKATPKMVEEYNKLAKYYSTYGVTREKMETGPYKRMRYIYSLMDPEQRKSAEALPPPPPVPASEEGEEVSKTNSKADVPPPPPPPAPPAPKVAKAADVPPPPPPTVDKTGDMPSPPPPPPSPIEAVEGWIEEGASFFYNGRSVSGKEALEIVQKNNGKNLNVQVEENNSGKTVRLSDNKK